MRESLLWPGVWFRPIALCCMPSPFPVFFFHKGRKPTKSVSQVLRVKENKNGWDNSVPLLAMTRDRRVVFGYSHQWVVKNIVSCHILWKVFQSFVLLNEVGQQTEFKIRMWSLNNSFSCPTLRSCSVIFISFGSVLKPFSWKSSVTPLQHEYTRQLVVHSHELSNVSQMCHIIVPLD